MKSIIRALFTAAFLLTTAIFSSADTGTAQTVLTSFDFSIVGVGLKASPEYQAVPKGIASKVNAAFEAAGFNLADLVAQLPKDYTVRAELSGPAFQTPFPLVTKPGTGFDLPTLAVVGRYTLSNIRLVDGSGNTLFGAVPQLVAIESINDPLVTSVTTRQLTQQELQDRGVTFDKSNFSAYDFTVGIATSSGQVPLTLPVIVPTSQTVQQTPTLDAPSTITLPPPSSVTLPPDAPQTAVIPQNLEVKPFMMEVQETEKVGKIQLPPIPGVVVIPGNIGFLHQYFSALALVSNGAPLQSGLTIRDVKATIGFPVGDDLVHGVPEHSDALDQFPGDDPLRMAAKGNVYFPRTMPVMNAGPDGKAGTADDIGSMQPGESGQADFTIEGMKEGTHKVDFEITATLDGLPIGPVTLKGKASGAVLVRNPDFAITLGHPATVRAGEEYDLFVTVSNTGKTVANMVTVGLDPRALSGAAFVTNESNIKTIDTIQPGSAATVKFRLKSQRTGKVTATAFESQDMRGRFILRAGVGENGIPLSPDSLILPYTGSLPSDLVTSAVGLLGQAWSVATAPTGALPVSVLPITKQTVTSRAYDLSEAGLRVLIGDDQVKAVTDLTFDFFGSDVYNKGFDSLRRSSTMGLELNRALGDIFKTGIDANGVIAFQAALADKVSYRPGHLSIISGNAPLRMRLTDASGKQTGGLDDSAAGRTIPYADAIAIGENGSSRTNLILATRLDSPSYTLELAADEAGSFDLGVVLPDAAGILTQYVFSGVSFSAEATGSIAIQPGVTMQLILDDDGDGVADRTLMPSSVTLVPDHAPHIVAATQLTPDFGPGGDKHGRNVAVLFSERVTKESAQNPANYGVDENLVKQVVLQPGNRMAFVLLRDGIGPFFERSLTARGLADQSGKSMSQNETLPIRITAKGPAAVVTGTVRTARGEPVPNATVRLYQLIWFDDGYSIEQRYALFSEKQGNKDGSYRFEYVLQNDDPAGPFQIEVVNPLTSEIGTLTTGVMFHGQQLQLDIFMKAKGSLSGVVRNEAGNPVGGVTVQVITMVDNRGQSKVTDASGAFSFSGLMVGAYSLKAVSQATLSEGSTMGTLPEDGTAISQDVTVRRVADIARGTVVGKVLGADGTTPRSGMIVIINGPNYQNWQRTSADGGFSFNGVYAGTITVKARDDNSGEQSESGGVLSSSGQIVTLNVIMKGTGTVTGLVKRDDDKSAEGLYVVAKPSQGQQRVLLTDGGGAFRVDNLPIGNVGIDIIDPRDFNRTVASGTVTILSAGDTANIALFVPLKALAVGTIQGTVYHRDGTPWANAPIKRVVDAWHYYALQADSAGKFSITNLPLGGYTLTVVAGNEVINASTDLWYADQLRDLDLQQGGLHPVGVGTVTGTTWDDAGKTTRAGADVTLYSTKPNQVGLLTYDTDNPTVVKSDPQTGRFTFSGLFQGSFTVSSSNIFRPTPVSASGKIESHGQIVTVDLLLKGEQPKPGEPPPVNQPGSVSGTVLMPDGSAAGRDVRVTLNFGGADVTVTTDDNGHFHFAPIIPAGNYSIIAEDPITTLKWKGSAYVPSGLDVPITIKLMGRGTVTVKVLRVPKAGDPAVPVPDADIILTGTNYPNDSASGVSDSAGQALFANLSEGSYAVSASGNGGIAGLSGRNQVNIPGDKVSTTVEVRLASSATVTGRFLKADGITPIVGGQITLKRNGQTIAYASSSSDPADAGRFNMQYVPLGDFTVEGYDPVTERRGIGAGRLNTDGETVVADVVVTPRGSVRGTVLNYGGSAPVAGAPVSISVSGVTGFNFSSVTAPDGTFYYSGVPAGRFTVNATDPSNGLSGQTTGSLSYENETVTTQVRIAPTGSIAGRVLMPDGVTPVTTTTVRLNGGTPQQVDSVTAAFRYDNLAAGRSYTLSTSQPNTRRTGSTIATISHDLEVANGDIRLRGVGTVSGVVRKSSSDQTPVKDARVDLQFQGITLTRTSSEDGSFNFTDIPTGPFTVTVPPSYLHTTGASQSGYPQNEGQVVALDLALGDVGSVKATVLLADGVTLSRGGGIRITTNTIGILTGITDSSGQYTFNNIPTPCTISLDVEDAAGLGIGKAYGVLAHGGQLLDLGTIVLDDKPIFVTAINPASGAVNVPINQTMRILFSEPADPSTVTNNSLYLTLGSTRVAGTLQLDANNGGATFTPSSPLKGFALYTLVVTDSITDRVGRKLALPQSVSFTTVDNIPPVITLVSPGNGTQQVAADAVVRVTFSEVVDPSSLDGITLTSGGVTVATRSDLIQNGTVVALTPQEPLPYNRTFTVTSSGVRDQAGNVMTGSIQSTFNSIDTIPPTVTVLSIPPNADLIKGGTVAVTAISPDSDTTKIDFYLDDLFAGSSNSLPFTFSVFLPREGTARIKAIAQDRVGNRGAASPLFELSVKPDQPPQVIFLTPADGSSVNLGTQFAVNIEGLDDLTVKEITLTVSGELNATLTNTNISIGKMFITSFNLTAPNTIAGDGTIILTALAKDSGSNLTQPVQRTLVLHDGTAPAISISSPGQMVRYKPGEMAVVNITAMDNIGVSSVVCTTSGAVAETRSFVIQPATNTSQTFSFIVPANAVSLAAINVFCSASDSVANTTSASMTLTVADVRPPVVISATISGYPADVPINSGMALLFSKPLNPATVTAASVILTETASGASIPSIVSLSGDRKTVTLKPTSLLVPGLNYTLTATSALYDEIGIQLAAPYVTTFNADATAPVIVSISPADASKNIPLGASITVRFNEQIDPASIASDKITLSSSNALVSGKADVSNDGLSLVFTPFNKMALSRTYTFTLKAGVRDLSGNATTTGLTATFDTQGPDIDLVGYWPMDGDWNDYSGKGNNGTPYSGVDFTSDKVAGTAAGVFNGTNGYVGFGASNAITKETESSVEAWIYPTDITCQNGGSGRDIYSEISANSGKILSLGIDCTGKAEFKLYNASTITSKIPLTPNKWYHLVATKDANGTKLYINGVLNGHYDAVIQPNNYNIDNTYAGYGYGYGYYGSKYYTGRMDELSLFKRALSPEDVFEHYNASFSSYHTPPSAPTVDPVTSPSYNNLVLLRGTKDVGSSIRINSKQIVAHDSNTTWQVLYSLALGQNLLDITSRDIAGNASIPISVTVDILPLKQKDSSIVGVWHLDSDWKDFSGNGYDGNSQNGPTFAFDRISGTMAGSFRGSNDYVAIGNLYGKFPNNAFTIGAWIKLDDTGDGARRTIAGGTGASSDFSLGLINNQFAVFTFDKTTGYYGKSGFVPETGKWYYVAGTYDGSRLKLYVNGELKSDHQAGWVQSVSGTDFWIGGESCCGNYFNGLVDEVRVNDRALTVQEILVRYNASQQITITSPGQNSRYKSGETGTASVSAISAEGIAKLFCNAAGAVSIGALVVPFDPPKNQISVDFTFQMAANANQSAPIRVSCVTETSSGTLGSAFIDMLAADLVAPVVTSLSVPSNVDLIKGNIIPVTAVSPDIDVALIDFYLDDQPVGSINTPPYTLQLTLDKDGLHHVKAVAQDLLGNRGVAAVLDLQVLPDMPPQVVISRPDEGSIVKTGYGYSVYVQVSDDLNLKETSLTASGDVEFTQTINEISGKSRNNYFYFDVPTTISHGGTVVLTASAKDSAGNIGFSTPRNLVLQDGTPPDIKLSSPGLSVKYRPGDTASVNISASDNFGVTRIICTTSGAATASQTFDSSAVLSASQRFDFPIPTNAAPSATINVSCSASDAAGNQRSSSVALTVADIVPPTLVSVSPVDGTSEVPINSAVTVTFSEAMSEASINLISIKMAETVSGAVVPATVNLSSDKKIVTLKPTLALIRGVSYTFTVAGTVSDETGNQMSVPFVGRFTTDNTPPAVVSVTPSDGSSKVPLDTTISVRFNEPVDLTSITDGMVVLTSQGSSISGSQGLSSDGLTLTFKPYSQLRSLCSYTFTLKAGVRDLSGNAVAADQAVSFITIGLNAGMVAYWPMDGDWNDYSGKGNNLSSNGAAASSVAVLGGQAAQIGLNSYLEVLQPTSDLNIGNQSWTVSAWVNTNSTINNQMTLIERYESGINAGSSPDSNANATYALRINERGNALFYVKSDSGQYYDVSDDVDIRNGAWHHIVGVLDRKASLMRIMVDGVQKKTTGIVNLGSINDAGSRLEIGRTFCSGCYSITSSKFTGLVDEISIYNRGFVPEDAYELYNATLTTDRTLPAAPTVEPVATPTNNNITVLRGTKPVGTSIRINEQPVVAHDSNTTWQVLYSLAPGQNSLDVTCRDKAGNTSPAVNLAIELLPIKQKDPDLLGAWHMDGNWLDYSGNGNAGTPNGDPIFTNDRVAGTSAGSFNSRSSVEIANSSSLNPNTITVSAWVKSGSDYWNSTGSIVSKRNAYILSPNQNSKGMSFYVWVGGDWRYVSYYDYSLDITKWHHYAGTYDGASIKLYIDGVLKGTTAYNGSIDTSDAGSLYIGWDDGIADTYYTSRHFYGLMDDVAIYKRALTSQEILALKPSPPPVISLTSPGQTVWYKPSETGIAKVTATNDLGIVKLSCNASGAASDGTLAVSFDPPQSQITQNFAFQVAPDAVVAAPIKLSCVAETVAGTLGSADLNIMAADPILPSVAISYPDEGSVLNTGNSFSVSVSGSDNVGLQNITIEASGELVSTKTLLANGTKAFSNSAYFQVPTTITHGGKILLTVTARDLAGNLSQSVVRTLLVHDSILPTITLTSPSQNVKPRTGDTVVVNINAGDNVGVSNISCVATGAPIFDQADPQYGSKAYSFDAAQTTVAPVFSFGIMPLSAYKFTNVNVSCTAFDAAGNKITSLLQLPLADMQAPVVTASSIQENGKNVQLNASVSLTFSERLMAASLTVSSITLTETSTGSSVPVFVALSSDRKTVTVKPSFILSRGTGYTITANTALTDENGNSLASPYVLHFYTETGPLMVQILVPTPNSINVPVGTAVSMRFNQAIDSASITSDMVSLISPSGSVTGMTSVSIDGLTLTFKPSANLLVSSAYLFNLKAGVRDLSGSVTNDGVSFTFITQAADSGLVGYWPMDGDWNDYSGKGNKGTPNNGVAFTTENLAGTAAGVFNGSDGYVSFGTSTPIIKEAESTIEAWIYPTETTCTTSGNRDIYSENSYSTKALSLGIDCTGKASFTYYNASTITSNVPLVPNHWYYLVATKESNGTKLYVNGVLSGRYDGVVRPNTDYSVNYIYAGYGYAYSSYKYYAGRIDELSLFKRALSAEDVFERFNAALSSKRPAPAAPTLEPVTSPTYNNLVLLRGSKESGTSVRVNGRQVVAHDVNTTWQSLYPLAIGQNALAITSHDTVGNVSQAVSVSIELINNQDTSMAALWHMDGNWLDYSGNNNNGSPSGALFANDAHSGSSGSFYGDYPYPYVGNSFTGFPIGNQPRTISAWIKLDSDGYGDRAILSYGSGSYNYDLYIDSANRVAMTNGYYGQKMSGTSKIADGKWHLATGVFEGPDSYLGKIYVDGVLESSAYFSSTNTSGTTFKIGSTNYTFKGLIDELAVYRRALSEAEIKALYSATSPVIVFTPVDPGTLILPGIASSITVTASHVQGISRLSCNATGAAAEGSMSIPFDSPQAQVAQIFNFTPAADASTYAPIRLSCVAETSTGAIGTAFLDAQVGDLVSPTVVGTSIGDNDSNVSITAPLIITFSEQLNPATIANAVALNKTSDMSHNVPGSVTISPDGQSLIFTPAAPLECEIGYVLTVSAAALRDISGNALVSDYLLHFTTQTPTSPVIESQGTYDAPYHLTGGRYESLTLRNSFVIVDSPVLADTVNLESGTVITHKSTGLSGMEHLDLVVSGALNIDATSRIDVSSRGYQAGRTTGNTFVSNDNGNISGGSYGGIGGAGNVKMVYGDMSDPVEPGSGGNSYYVYNIPGNGGGLVRIKAATINLVGGIFAEGGQGSKDAGGGSGGGIRIDVGTMEGIGTISARGGIGVTSYGGSGGRIAVYYDAMTLPKANITAAGGTDANYTYDTRRTGGAGTVYLKDRAKPNPGLIIYNGGNSSTNVTPVAGGAYEFLDVREGCSIALDGPYAISGDMVLDKNNWVINGDLNVTGNLLATNSTMKVLGTVTVGGDLRMTGSNLTLRNDLNVTGSITLAVSSTVSHEEATLVDVWKLNIKAASVKVDSSSYIDARGKGYLGGNSNNVFGRTRGNLSGSSKYSGGSYGGSGGSNGNSDSIANTPYGNPDDPNDLGSGSGYIDWNNGAGAGGGLVRIAAAKVTVDGGIMADGACGTTCGSGGGIRIDAGILDGNGFIRAMGSGGNYAGGGGRIAIYYDTMSFPQANFNVSSQKPYYGIYGGAGTIYLKDNAKKFPDVIVDNKGIIAPEGSTPIRTVGQGTIAIITSDSLVMSGAAWTPGEFKGMKVNPNIKQSKIFTIRDNTIDTLFIETTSGNLNDVATVGDTCSGVYELNSLRVTGGAGLVVAGQLIVSGELIVDNATLTTNDVLADSVSVINGGKIGHPGATLNVENRLSVTAAASITIDAASRIDVTGRGYLGGSQVGNGMNGRTYGNKEGSSLTGGGGYGGYGGGTSNGTTNTLYGDPADPKDPGSGGGSSYTYMKGGNGGGVVRIKSPVMTLDGKILANGSAPNNAGVGAGSGGAVRVDAGILKGNGYISANGGVFDNSYVTNGNGGGGRIALYYDSKDLPTSHLSATGGAIGNSALNGGAGTIYLKDSTKAKPDLIINNGGFATVYATPVNGAVPTGLKLANGVDSPYGHVDLGGGAKISLQGDFVANNDLILNDTGMTIDGNLSLPGSLTLNNSTFAVSDLTISGNLSMTTSTLTLQNYLKVSGAATLSKTSILSHYSATLDKTWRLDLTATSVSVDTSSSINATGCGYRGGYRDNNTQAYFPARTRGNLPGSTGYGSGSYGGYGFKGWSNTDFANAPYGDPSDPNDLGSGGSGWNLGGAGGGLISIKADTVTLDGAIRADGTAGTSSSSGGGSGGGIRIDTGVLSGSGLISASGGYGYNGGGGGGRIAVYYNTLSLPVTKFFAQGSYYSGGAGTIYLKDNAKFGADLVVDNNNSYAPEESTVLRTVGQGIVSVITADSLIMDGANWISGEFKGMKINPNLEQSKTFTIRDNTTDTIFIDSSEGNLNEVAAVGDTFSGVIELNSLRVVNRGGLVVNGLLKVANDIVADNGTLTASNVLANNLSIIKGGNLTHIAATTTTESRLTVNAVTSLIIDASSRIDVSGRGYLGAGQRDNNSSAGRTSGNTDGSSNSSGGSYGGSGGYYSGVVAALYGDPLNPNELGSGGGSENSNNPGGSGGGLARINAGTIQLNGSIVADGINGGNYGGGGSGGGIRIDTGTLSGSGYVYARGGGSRYRGGGGGGRIAIYYGTMTLPTANVIASGAATSYPGGAGTIRFSLLP